MKLPLVSCIMPTANRQQYILYAIDYFLHQDYLNSELIILDDGIEPINPLILDNPRIRYLYLKNQYVLGTKRNMCCEEAEGEIIIHWDDDDWYAEDWISKQLDSLNNSNCDITGLCNINFYSPIINKRWNYRSKQNDTPWVYGATLAYKKSFWKKHLFKAMNTGEDNEFIIRSKGRVQAHDYTEGYLGIIHNDNMGIELFENPREKLQLEKWMKIIQEPDKSGQEEKLKFPSDAPLITCIMPTANRPQFIPASIGTFKKQDYPNKELLIIDDGETPVEYLIPEDPRIKYFYFKPKNTIGTKRNWACERAKGQFITHWDDDDWYAENWLSHQVNAIINSGADISGINQIQFFSPSLKKYWMTKNSNSKRPWLTGQSLTYRKSFWENHPFKDIQIGEDDDFVRNNGAKVFAHEYFQGFLATLHPNNTSMKFFEDPNTKSHT